MHGMHWTVDAGIPTGGTCFVITFLSLIWYRRHTVLNPNAGTSRRHVKAGVSELEAFSRHSLGASRKQVDGILPTNHRAQHVQQQRDAAAASHSSGGWNIPHT